MSLNGHAAQAANRVRSALLAAALLATIPIACPSLAAQPSDPGEPQRTRLALLVGVAKYANLSDSEQLEGCANDVKAMQQLLVGRFGFELRHIVTLVNEQATAAAIRQAFEQLQRQVDQLPPDAPPGQIVFHFSGHGSQILDQPPGDPDRDERDGYDETLVPYDASQQGGAEDIRDDEINRLIRTLSEDGRAEILLIYDCCHSGTGARGAVKYRQLSRPQQPAAVTDNAPPLTQKKLPPGVVFLSACRAREVEPEFRDEDEWYGLMTRFLVQVLSEERTVSTLSYDLLQKAIVARYRRDGRVLQPPTPQLEGNTETLRRPILGCGRAADLPPYFEYEALSANRVRLKAGRFQDVTVGSLFEPFAAPEQITAGNASSEPRVWLRVIQVDATSAEAEPVMVSAEKPATTATRIPDSLRKGYAIERHRAPSDAGLRLKIVRVQADGTDGPALTRDQLPMALGQLLRPGQPNLEWLSVIEDDASASEVLLRIDGEQAALFPSTGVAELSQAGTAARDRDGMSPLRGGWGPLDVRTGQDESPAKLNLVDYLLRITRARNLIRLSQTAARGGDYDVQLDLLEVDYDFDNERVIGTRLWPPDPEQVLAVPEGAVYGFRITNRQSSGKSVYVSLLSISASMGIEVVMPYEEPFVELQPGESVDSSPFQCEPPLGENHAILLVTRERLLLPFSKRPELPTITRGASQDNGAGDLQDQLLEQTYFRRPASRGRRLGSKRSDTTWHAQLLSWRVVPTEQ